MRKKHIAKVLLPVIILSFVLPLSAYAAEGYSYENLDLAFWQRDEYKGEDLRRYQGFKFINDEENALSVEHSVQIWAEYDTEAPLLQFDVYQGTITGLPTAKETYKDINHLGDKEDYGFNSRSVQFSTSRPDSYYYHLHTLTNPDQYLQYIFPKDKEYEEDENSTLTAEKTTYAGYPAIIKKLIRETVSYNDEGEPRYSYTCRGNIYIYLTDLPMPTIDIANDIYEPEDSFDEQEFRDIAESIGKCYLPFELAFNYYASASESAAPGAAERYKEQLALVEEEMDEILKRYDNSISVNIEKTTKIYEENYVPGANDESEQPRSGNDESGILELIFGLIFNGSQNDYDRAGPGEAAVIGIAAILISILLGGAGGFIPPVPAAAGVPPVPASAPPAVNLGKWIRFDGDGDAVFS